LSAEADSDEYGSSGPNDDKDSFIDDWYDETKDDQNQNKKK
jgi:hypothetical protein